MSIPTPPHDGTPRTSASGGPAAKPRAKALAVRFSRRGRQAGASAAKPVVVPVEARTYHLLKRQLAGSKSLTSKGLRGLMSTVGEALDRAAQTGGPVHLRLDRLANGSFDAALIEIAATPAAEPAAAAPAARQDDVLHEARERGRAVAARILAGADMLTADQFAARLGTSHTTVNSWRRAHRVLGLQGAKRGCRFPEWQIDDHGVPFDVLPELFRLLGGNPWTVHRFLVQHHPELGGATAKDALRRGRVSQVLETATAIGHSFS